MNLLGLAELNSRRTARAQAAELAALREESARLTRSGEDALRLATLARSAEAAAAARATTAEAALVQERSRVAALDGPPAVARELISMADRLVDLAGDGAPTDPDQARTAIRWLGQRIGALLALCEVAPIVDDGVLDFMRHEVVADRPAPRAELVDHIADTVRPGYLWRHDLLRPQQVVAYVATDR